jgi:basic membrane protein A
LAFRFTALTVLVVALSLVGCDPAPKSGGQPGSTLKVGLVFDSGGRGDKSFNDSAWEGLERAHKDFKVEEHTVDSKSQSDYEPNIEALSEAGNDLVVAVGISMKDAVEKVAPKFPNVKYAIVDASVTAPNVRSLLFKEEEGSFLAGYLAGLTTKSNKIGFVGGMELPLIKKFEYGYEAGAKTANPKVELLPAKFTGGWDNVDDAKAAANVLFNQGADIVYHAAGRAGLGVIGAAKDHGKYAIGVDSDQDYIEKGTVLTSMVKHVDVAVYETIKDVKEGKFAPGDKIYDLKSGGVDLSPMTYTKDTIGSANLAKVSEIADGIKSGNVKVPSTAEELTSYLSATKRP